MRGLYRGLLPAYGLQFSVTAVRFAVYDVQKRLVGEEFGKQAKKTQDGRGGGGGAKQPALRNFGMGCIGGLWGAIFGNPFFLLKSQFQTYSSDGLRGPATRHAHATCHMSPSCL